MDARGREAVSSGCQRSTRAGTALHGQWHPCAQAQPTHAHARICTHYDHASRSAGAKAAVASLRCWTARRGPSTVLLVSAQR